MIALIYTQGGNLLKSIKADKILSDILTGSNTQVFLEGSLIAVVPSGCIVILVNE